MPSLMGRNIGKLPVERSGYPLGCRAEERLGRHDEIEWSMDDGFGVECTNYFSEQTTLKLQLF